MPNDLAYLARRMKDLANTVEANGPKLVTAIVTNLGPTLIYSTPVDTSRARINWQPSIGSVPSDVLFPYPDKPPAADYGGKTAVSNILSLANKFKGGTYFAITNNLDYIQDLNNGTSAQAPAAFVEQSIAMAMRAVEKFRMLRNAN